MPSYLSEIVATHRRRAAGDRRATAGLIARAQRAPAPASFAAALRRPRTGADAAPRGLAVIAEVKRRSPSRGELAPGLDPAEVAAAYAAGGAACLSVLTDRQYFGGSASDLAAARRAAGLPVLRKDFTVCDADVCDARIMGADAILLIAAALDDAELAGLRALADRLSLDALVEVHSARELDRALATGARLVGVNQRDLETFEVRADLAEQLAASIPPEVVAVAESGVTGPGAARRLGAAGYDAILVGEALVTAPDRRAAVAGLTGHPVGTRGRAVAPQAAPAGAEHAAR